MNGSQANVIAQLPELTWRDLDPVPVEDASYDFSHDQAERRYPYVDGAGHDHTGRGPIRFTARLLFHNTLQPNLYPHTWEDWRAALFDGSSGELVHPELGSIRARVMNGAVKLTAHSRAGVSVEVTWVETLDNPDKGPADFAVLSISLNGAAQAADLACKKLGLVREVIPSLPATSLFDAIQTFQFAVDAIAVHRALSYVRMYENAVAQLESTVNTLRSPVHTWAAMWNLELVEQGLVDLLEQVEQPARPVASLLLDRSTTLDAFARSIGNTVAEVVELNPTALGRPSVPAGTLLRFYTAT